MDKVIDFRRTRGRGNLYDRSYSSRKEKSHSRDVAGQLIGASSIQGIASKMRVRVMNAPPEIVD